MLCIDIPKPNYPSTLRMSHTNLVGGWATPLKNISQLGWLFPIYGKIKNVPNHQPLMLFAATLESFAVSFHKWLCFEHHLNSIESLVNSLRPYVLVVTFPKQCIDYVWVMLLSPDIPFLSTSAHLLMKLLSFIAFVEDPRLRLHFAL